MTSLRIERRLAAGPDRVWRALTEAGALAEWFWPERLRPTAVADARPGGAFRIAATGSPMAVSGIYLEVDRPHRLVFTWRWDGDYSETLVTIELVGDGAGTSLILTHERFADDTDRANHEVGWSDCLGRLPGYLGDDDEPDPGEDDADEPPSRRRRAGDHTAGLGRPRLLGGPEDIEEARQSRPQHLGKADR